MLPLSVTTPCKNWDSLSPNGLITSFYHNVFFGFSTVYGAHLYFCFGLLQQRISNHSNAVDMGTIKRLCIWYKQLCVSSLCSRRNFNYGDPVFFSIRITHWHHFAFHILIPPPPRLKGLSRVCELLLELRHCSLPSPACIYSLPVRTVETDHKAYYGARSGVRAAFELSACIHLPTKACARAQTLCHPPFSPRIMWCQSHGFQASG